MPCGVAKNNKAGDIRLTSDASSTESLDGGFNILDTSVFS